MRFTQRAIAILLLAIVAAAPTWTAAAGPLAPHGGTIVQAAPLGAGGEYHPLTPTRIFDSRPGAAINDVAPLGKKPTAAAATSFDISLLGVGGVPAATTPATVLAVMVSITVAEPSALGYLSAFPTGTDAGISSTVNFNAGQTVPNLALVRPGADGRLRIQLTTPSGAGSAHVLVDVFGWFSTSDYATSGARLITTTPGRILDTRGSGDPATGGEWITVPIRGAVAEGMTVPNDPNVVGVVINLTGANDLTGSGQTFVSAVPEQTASSPTTSNLNLVRGQVRANLAMVPVGADGAIRLFNEAGSTHLIVDVVGYLLAGQDPLSRTGRVVPLVAPFRILDTRQSEFGAVKLGPGQAEDWGMDAFVASVQLDGQPLGPQAGVIANLTAAQLTRQYPTVPVTGFLTIYPPPDRPNASNVNFTENNDVPNLSVVKFSACSAAGLSYTDCFRVYNGLGSTHYIVDVAAVIME